MRAKWWMLLSVAVVLFVGTRRPQLPGSLGVVHAQIRFGMPWEEAVTLVAASGDENADGG